MTLKLCLTGVILNSIGLVVFTMQDKPVDWCFVGLGASMLGMVLDSVAPDGSA